MLIRLVNSAGDEASIYASRIISIDDVPYTPTNSPQEDVGLERRVSNLEKALIALLGEPSLQPQPQTASSSVALQPKPIPEQQVPPETQPVQQELQPSLDVLQA